MTNNFGDALAQLAKMNEQMTAPFAKLNEDFRTQGERFAEALKNIETD